MILGERFVWAHVGKTGGDAVRSLFAVVDDLVVHMDDPAERRKHHTFSERGAEALQRPIRALNLRRLPGWQLSMVQHRARHGPFEGREPGQLAPPDQVIARSQGDSELVPYLFHDGQPLEIHHWLRMEHLRDDFLAFVSSLRRISRWERWRITRAATKPPGRYDHNVDSYFTPAQIRRLYAANPVWAETEWKVYGDLALPR